MSDAPHIDPLPFDLPPRAPVTRIRGGERMAPRPPGRPRTQALPGYDETYRDIVDYIVRITDEIWSDRDIARIYETYDHACTVYSPSGVTRSVEEVVASTTAALAGSRQGSAEHLNVAWSEDEPGEFYTSHLGYGYWTHSADGLWGPPTGRRLYSHFVADCVSSQNRIHTEWLVRENGAIARQLGLDLVETARKLAQTPALETRVLAPPTRLVGQAPRAPLDLDPRTPEGWARDLFDAVWTRRRLDRIGASHAGDVLCHAGGGRRARGPRNVQALILKVLAAIPDAVMSVDHVCWSQETDGVILAVRWRLEGSTAPGEVLGDCPRGLPIVLAGASHLRFAGGQVVEEWMMFDELGALAAALRT